MVAPEDVVRATKVFLQDDDMYCNLHYLCFRTCLGPIIGGALVYKVGFQYMAAVSLIDNDTYSSML